MFIDHNNYFNAKSAAFEVRCALEIKMLQSASRKTRDAMRLNAKNRGAFLIECRRQGIKMQDILKLLGVI